ncbi:hypothetical protein [Paenibacillus taiwanensis]|nr:hypothetical protein [Paenibacillus taiwanensis]
MLARHQNKKKTPRILQRQAALVRCERIASANESILFAQAIRSRGVIQ